MQALIRIDLRQRWRRLRIMSVGIRRITVFANISLFPLLILYLLCQVSTIYAGALILLHLLVNSADWVKRLLPSVALPSFTSWRCNFLNVHYIVCNLIEVLILVVVLTSNGSAVARLNRSDRLPAFTVVVGDLVFGNFAFFLLRFLIITLMILLHHFNMMIWARVL